MIPVDRINQLIPYQNLLTGSQNNKLMEALKQRIPLLLNQQRNRVVDSLVHCLQVLVFHYC